MCPDVCWNQAAGLCETCAPDEKEELAAQQSLATSEQIYQKTRETDYTQHINFEQRTSISQCSHCHTKIAASDKFCPSCGAPNAGLTAATDAEKRFCSECGTPTQAGQKFCSGCGHKLV